MIKNLSGLSSAADRPHLRGGRDWDNTFLIGHFAHDQGMSVAETTQLLALIQNVSDRHVAKLRTQYPGIDMQIVKCMRGCWEAIHDTKIQNLGSLCTGSLLVSHGEDATEARSG
jgi:hypothetical protein